MSTQQIKIERFRKLHIPGDPLVLYNIWDPGSAKAVTQAGAKAIATSSWAVAEALGFSDGEQTPLELVLDNLRRIVKATKLPVTVDFESGYGGEPKGIGETIALAIEAGAVGCNLEDSDPTNRNLREIADQVARIRSARQAADVASLPFFINARTDVFLQRSPDKHNSAMVSEALKRAEAYKEAGADGLFVPGLGDTTLIATLTTASPLPVNIMVDGSGPSIATLAKSGVARVSYGATPYATLRSTLEEAARGVRLPSQVPD
jgi:2-methylisocitrate lyase-like PEP mutase family enzyme